MRYLKNDFGSYLKRYKYPLNRLSKKLILLFLVIALLFLLVVGASLSHFFKYHFKYHVKPHLFQYLEYVRNDIGVPADREKAQTLANKLNIDIVIIDEMGAWASNAETINTQDIQIEDQYTNNGIEYGEVEIGRKDYASMAANGTMFLFDLSQIKQQGGHPRALMPLAFLLVILLALYYATRKLFAPILTIQSGVKTIGSGKLDHRIHINRKDELGELANNINDMAAELQKMLDAKRQLLLAVSHELRSPLTRANVAIEMLDDSGFKQQIKDDIQEIESLIAEILETERLSSHHHALEKDDYRINDIVREVIRDYFIKSELNLSIPDTELTAFVDKPRIKLLLKNIIGNALQYQTQKTAVTVSTQDNNLLIQVEDDGKGIAESDLPHLTEPFYRVDPARQRQTGGYGLGLYLCRVITEAHEGTLHIDSQINKGTTVTVCLPLLSGEEAHLQGSKN